MPDGFVGQRTATRHDADFTGLMDVSWHDSDLAFAWGDDPWAVWSDQHGLAPFDGSIDVDHVQNGHTFGDRADDFDARIDGFEDRIGGIEDWQSFDGLTGLAGGDPTDHFGPVLFAAFGMKGSRFASDSLADNPGIFVDKNAHECLLR